MTRSLVTLVLIILVAGCANPRRIDPLPPIKSPDTSSQVFLKNVFTDKHEMRDVTFTLDNVPIYRFGETRQFSFYLDSGDYLFGYDKGSKKCQTNVHIRPAATYVFEFGPDCRIELSKE